MAIRDVLLEDAEVLAAWLSGSLGRGAGDAFSDVDILVLAKGDHAAALGQRYQSGIDQIAEPACVRTLHGGRVVSVVTMDWRRFDLSFVTRADLKSYDRARVIALFNKVGEEPPEPDRAAYVASPAVVANFVQEFLRVLGLAVVLIGRGEGLAAQEGHGMLRRMIVDLMLEANGVAPADRGGALHLNGLLTHTQRRQLEALPPIGADRDSLLHATAAVADLFMPLARALAAESGTSWPVAFEAATRKHLADNLGLRFT
jgi:predicted nucleotidyltransferase